MGKKRRRDEDEGGGSSEEGEQQPKKSENVDEMRTRHGCLPLETNAVHYLNGVRSVLFRR